MHIVSFARFGYAGEIVKVEADLRRGIPAVDVVGLPGGAVKEARERMRAAIRNSGLEYPKERILINLSPADLKKEGSSFDLPIALAVLTAKDLDNPTLDISISYIPHTIMVLGELELSGTVRSVKGVLAAVSRGLECGISHFIIPKKNEAEARNCVGAYIFGVENLTEALHALKHCFNDNEKKEKSISLGQTYVAQWSKDIYQDNDNPIEDIADIKGQEILIRAMEIAAAGGHNLIAYGPPGCGKTLALSQFHTLLPDLDQETSFTVTRIHSLAGLIDPNLHTQTLDNKEISSLYHIKRPPFRQPHTSASLEGMIGGGKFGNPGEISLAHGGVLFLDEAVQFKTSVLQALRTPLETGQVTVTRANRSSLFPSRFQLLLAVNPCPCGNFAHPGQICTCTPEGIASYWRRIAFPLLDRVDIRVQVQTCKKDTLVQASSITTHDLRKTIKQAREQQWKRNRKTNSEWLNASIKGNQLENVCAMSQKTTRVFTQVIEQSHFSARGAHGVLRLARTIADLEANTTVEEEHIMEACYFRKWGEFVPDFLIS